MKAFVIALLGIVVTTCFISASSADTMSSGGAAAAAPTIVMPDALTWTPAKNLPGVWMATVYGDPTTTGVYTLRVKLADGAKIPVHWHNDSERVTVLSGTFMVGVGDNVDMASMKALGPGSFVYIPAGVHHYAMAKGETIVQTTGNGPFSMNMAK